MFDEPKDKKLDLIAANDSRETVRISYRIKELYDDREVLCGEAEIAPDTAIKISSIPAPEKGFYLIEWSGTENGKNHFTAAIGDKLDINLYLECMKKSGFFSAFEGFDI